MDILQIRYFSHVYETLNYARSADLLHLSRQGLRKVIHNLEREVGSPLFVNHANRLAATPAADELYRASRTFVHGYGELQDAVAGLRLARKEVVRLGSTYDADDVFTRSELRAFRVYPSEKHALEVSLRYQKDSRPAIYSQLLGGEIDYAHVVFTEIDENLFDYRLSRSGRVHLTLPASHPLACAAEVTVDDLAGVALSVQNKGDGVTDLLLERAISLDTPLDIKRFDNNLETRLADAVDGASATLTYLSYSDDERYPSLTSIPFADPLFQWRYAVVAKKGQGDPFFMSYFAGHEIDWDAIVAATES